MTLDDLKLCCVCRKPPGLTFYVLRSTLAVVDQHAVRTRVGLGLMFPGAPALASAFDPSGESAVGLLADQVDEETKRPIGWNEVHVCAECLVERLPQALDGGAT